MPRIMKYIWVHREIEYFLFLNAKMEKICHIIRFCKRADEVFFLDAREFKVCKHSFAI